MKKLKTLQYSFVLVLLLQIGCISEPWEPNFDVENVNGYRPIYVSREEANPVMMPPQEMQDAGKIYVFDDYLLIVDKRQGIHIFDNTDAENPVNVGFLRLAGSTDIAIRNNILYANQNEDLLAIDISNPSEAKLTGRVKGVLPNNSNFPDASGYFECVDPLKGIVIGWEEALLKEPKCYR